MALLITQSKVVYCPNSSKQCFLHYLAKNKNKNCIYLHSMSYDYFIKNFKNTHIGCFFIDNLIRLSKQPTPVTRCSKYPLFVQTHAYRRFLHLLTAASTTLLQTAPTSTSRCLSSSTFRICISYTRCCMTVQIL